MKRTKKYLYDLSEPPHTFSPAVKPNTVVSHRGLIIQREAARYFLLLYKLGIAGINPDMKYFISKLGRLTLMVSEKDQRKQEAEELEYLEHLEDIENDR